MKIGLITTHNAINYGAVLQTYATYEFLSKKHDVKIINYLPKYVKNDSRVIRIGASPKKVIFAINDLINLSHRINRINSFKQFRSDNFKLTDELSREEILNGKCECFDLYITGSDQIWNPRITDGIVDPIYFLNFSASNSRTISYAASMGNYDFTDQEESKVSEYLKRFEKISVREEHAQARLDRLGYKSEVVLDPVFLLSKVEWEERFNLKIEGNKNEKYIFVFPLRDAKATLEAVKRYNNGNYKIMTPGPAMGYKKISGIEYIKDMRPDEFLKYIYNSELVVTNSFHGTAFSVLFNKNFFTTNNAKDNTRSSNLLTKIGLHDRIISLGNLTSQNSIDNDIDYSDAILKLNKIVDESRNFLDI